MSFSIEYDKQPLHFLRKLDKQPAKRILDKIDELLLVAAFPHQAKTIIGEHGVFRIRIGDYRALYRVNYSVQKIVIFKIEKRAKVYN